MIGRFHEVSVHAPDLLESLDFYERLGFTQVTAGEALPYPYAVVADGRLAIGLHGRELPQSPLLAFVLPGLLERLATLERRGIEILDRRLGDDVFNEASLEAGGQRLRLLEARTHSPASLGPARLPALAGSRNTRCRSRTLRRLRQRSSGSASCRPRKATSRTRTSA